MDDAIYEFDGGVGDILFVYEDRIVIRHKGVLNFFAMGMKGDKTVYLSDITSVQLKKVGMLTAGYLQFSLPGGNENNKGVFGATQDENSITFGADKNDKAEEIANYLNEALRRIKTLSNTPNANSASDEIRKFKNLLDEGIITQEEFDIKKKQLLNL